MQYIKYNNLLLDDVFESDTDFLEQFKESQFYNKAGFNMTDEELLVAFNLIYAKFNVNPIANASLDIFKLKFFGTIWQYGPKWALDVQIQAKIRSLGLDDNSEIYKGSKAIYNQAQHPETAPSDTSLEELEYITGQNTTNYKKSKLEGLASLMELLRTDVTEVFTNQFRKLFSKFVQDDSRILCYYEEEGYEG